MSSLFLYGNRRVFEGRLFTQLVRAPQHRRSSMDTGFGFSKSARGEGPAGCRRVDAPLRLRETTSLPSTSAKRGLFSPKFVCLFVCLFSPDSGFVFLYSCSTFWDGEGQIGWDGLRDHRPLRPPSPPRHAPQEDFWGVLHPPILSLHPKLGDIVESKPRGYPGQGPPL